MPSNPSGGLSVAVTGASGYVASRLIRQLLQDEAVERVVAFDVRDLPATPLSEKLVFDKVDVRDPALEARFRGIDVVVHLAFVMDPIRDEKHMRDVNVEGSQNVFRAAGRAGVARIVYASSATVYGAHPDNDVPLTEESPLRANLDFSYPAHKLEVEYVVREFREEHADVKVAVLRPAIVFGPHVDNAWSHMLELPVVPAVQGYRPPMQFVHEEDVARALAFAVTNELDGAFNVAPEGWIEPDELDALIAKRRVDLPESIAFQVADRLWSLGMAEAPAGMLHYVMHPWVLSAEKLAREGFSCTHTSEEALVATLERTRGKVRVGRTRLDRRDIRRGAATGAGIVGSVLVWRGLKRRSA